MRALAPTVPRSPKPRRAGGFPWRQRFSSLVVLGLLARAHVAVAQEQSAAQKAYEQGVTAFRDGDYGKACGFLADSYRLEPLPGVLFTWATCELRADHTASAAQHYGDFLALVSTLPPAERAAQEERRQVAERERVRLLADLPYLTVVVPAVLQRSSTVLRDGARMAPASLGLEQPVDPGEHVLVYRGADGTHAEQRITLAKREHKTIVLGFTNRNTEARPHAAAPRPLPRPEQSLSPWFYVSGGVGLAGVLTGSIAGLMALRDKDVVDGECLGLACSARGKDAADAARVEATVSTFGFAAGAAGVLTAAIVYLAGRPEHETATQRGFSVVAVSPTAVGVVGAF